MKLVFEDVGEFKALYAAERWCRERGISFGSMEAHKPTGLLLGDFAIAKWHNLRQADKNALHGVMRGDMRNGPVTILLNEDIAAKVALVASPSLAVSD